jgi:DNA primase
MAKFGDQTIEQVRERADIVEIIGSHVRLRRSGRNFMGLCPFHNEKTPSFSVNPERGFFHCFGCGAGGTVFNFVMKVEGLSFPEAVRSLARRYGIRLPEQDESGAVSTERNELFRANQVAAEFFFHVLWNTPDGATAREYLKSRGVSPDTARAFMLGYAPARPASLARALEKRGLAERGLKLGLLNRDGTGASYDAFRARVMFPIRDAQGRVVAFGGRVLEDRQPKYLNSPESPLYSKARTLYGIYEARQAIAHRDRAIVVEGYFDVIALWQAGFPKTVASCGTSLTAEQLRTLGRYSRNVMACFDGDEAGRKASLRALEVFLEAGLLGRGIFVPQGFDPDTLVGKRGSAAMEELIEGAELLIDYFLREQAREARGSVEARARAAERVAAMLRLVANPFEMDLLARKAADALGVGEDTLRRAARGRAASSNRAVSRPAGATSALSAGDAASKAEFGLVALALFRPELRAELGARCAACDFADESLGALFEEACGLAPHESYEALMAERLAPEQQGRLSELAVAPLLDNAETAARMAGDFIAALERRRRRREIEEKKRALSEARDGSDPAHAQAVIALKRAPKGNDAAGK